MFVEVEIKPDHREVYECYLPLRVGEYVVCGLPEEQYLGKLLRGPG